MANLSPPRFSSGQDAYVWSERQQLEINPNHWAADYVQLALPINRPFLEDASPFQSLVSFSRKGTELDLGQVVSSRENGNVLDLLGLTVGQGIRISAPHTHLLGAPGTEFTLLARHQTSATAINFRPAFSKGGGGGTTVWFGLYGNAVANGHSWRGQFDDGTDPNTLIWTDIELDRSYNDGNWHFTGMGQHHGNERFVQVNAQRKTEATTFTINNAHDYILGDLDSLDYALDGELKDILVLNKYISGAQFTDLDQDFGALFRPKVRRRFFDYSIAAGGTIFEDTLSLGLSQSQAVLPSTLFESVLSLAVSKGLSVSPIATIEGQAGLGLSHGVASTAIVAAETALSLGLASDAATSGGLVFGDSLSLGVQSGQSTIGGLSLEHTIALGLQSAMAAAGDVDFFTSVAMGLSPSVAADGALFFEAAISLNAQQSMSAEVVADYDVVVALSAQQIFADIAETNIEAAATLSAQLAQAVTTAVISTAAPAFRTLAAASDDRTIVVSRDNRTITISGD